MELGGERGNPGRVAGRAGAHQLLPHLQCRLRRSHHHPGRAGAARTRRPGSSPLPRLYLPEGSGPARLPPRPTPTRPPRDPARRPARKGRLGGGPRRPRRAAEGSGRGAGSRLGRLLSGHGDRLRYLRLLGQPGLFRRARHTPEIHLCDPRHALQAARLGADVGLRGAAPDSGRGSMPIALALRHEPGRLPWSSDGPHESGRVSA